MTQPATPPPASPDEPSKTATPSPRRKRGRWWKILLVVIVLLLLLVLLLPTIASTSPVRRLVLSQANGYLAGRVEVADWSLGWFGGQKLTGVKIYDSDRQLLLDAPKITVEQGLIGLTKGITATVDSPEVKISRGSDGSLNVEKIAKPDEGGVKKQDSKPKSDKPIEIPNYPVRFAIVNGKGSITGEPGVPPVAISNLNVTLTAPGGNAPIENKLDLTATIGDGAPGTISVNGRIDAIKDGKLALETAKADQVITIKNFSMGSLAPLLPPDLVNKLDGTTNGTITAALVDGKMATVVGDMTVAKVSAAGPALKGDTYSSDALTLTIPTVTISMPNGPTDVDAMHVKTGSGPEQPITVEFQQGKFTAFADATIGAILKAIDGGQPGENGKIAINANVDVGKLAKQLPNTFKVVEGTDVTGGQFATVANIDITPQKLNGAVNVSITGVSAHDTAKNQTITLQPITVDASASAGGGGNWLASVRDVKLDLKSAFATGNFSGPTLASINGQLHAVLDKAQSELGQIIDFGGTKLAGNVDVAVATKGDLTNTATEPAQVSAGLTVTGLRVDGLKDKPPVDQKLIKGDLVAKISTDANSNPNHVEITTAKLRMGDETNPSIAADATATLAMAGAVTNVPVFEVKQFAVDFPRLAAEVGSLVPQLKNATGVLNASLTGSAENVTGEPKATLSKLSVTQSDGGLSLASVDNAPLVVSMPKSASIPQVTGALAINVDAVKASGWTQKLLAENGAVTSQQIRNGKLTGTLTFARSDATRQGISADFVADDLAIATSTGQASFKPIKIGLKAAATDDLKKATIESATIDGDLLTAGATNVVADLNATDPMKMVESADASISIPNLAPLYSLVMAFMPAAQEPLAVTSGSFAAKASVDHAADGSAALKVSELRGEKIAVTKANSTYQIASFMGTAGLAPSGNGVAGKFDIPIKGVKQFTDGKEVFSEDEVSLTGDVATTASDININALAVKMVSSGALALNVKGAVRDYTVTRKFDNVTADVTYELEPLWKIAKPFVAADPESTLATLQTSGKVERKWTVSGQLPANLPFNEAVKQLAVTGGVAVPLATLEGSKLEALDLPITLSNGVATIGGAPGKFNDGSLDLSGTTVDLTDAVAPRLSIPTNKQLISKATLNPFIANKFIGKFVNPVFTGATQAKGLIDLKAISTERVALDPDVLQGKNKSVPSGSAELSLTVKDLELGGAGVQLLQLTNKGAQGFIGEINDGRIRYNAGVVNSDITMNFKQDEKTYPLRFAGNVGLQNFSLSPMVASLPTAILNKLNISNELKKYLPPTIDVSFTGTTLAPQLRLDQMFGKLIQDATQKALTDNLLGKGTKDKSDAQPSDKQTTPSDKSSSDPIGSLIDQLTKDKDSDKSKDKNKNDSKNKKNQDKNKKKKQNDDDNN